MIDVPIVTAAKVLGIKDGRYRTRINGHETTFPLEFCDTSIAPPSDVVLVSDLYGIKIVDPKGSKEMSPVVGYVVQRLGKQFREDPKLHGLVFFDGQDADRIAVVRDLRDIANTLKVLNNDSNRFKMKEGPYVAPNGFAGFAYETSENNKSGLLARYVREGFANCLFFVPLFLAPVSGLTEIVDGSARLKPGMLEYCVSKI